MRLPFAARLGSLLLVLLGCAARTPPATTAGGGGAVEVDRFFQHMLEDWVRDDPEAATSMRLFAGVQQEALDARLTDGSDQFLYARVRQARALQDELGRFDHAALSPRQRLAADVLAWSLDDIVRGERFIDQRYPFNQFMVSPQSSLPTLMTDLHPIARRRDVETYVARLRLFGIKFDQTIAAARARADKGILPPRFILQATIAQMRRFVKPSPAQNILYTSLATRSAKLADLDAEIREALLADAVGAIAEVIYPAYGRAAAALEAQLPAATDDAGFWKLPGGADAYAYYLRKFTTTDLTPDQIHARGLAEVARIEGQMDGILRQLGHTQGTVEDRFTRVTEQARYPDGPDVRTRVLADYQRIVRDAETRSVAAFDLRPRSPIEVHRIPEFRERNAAANYTPPPLDGSRAAFFNVPLPGPLFDRVEMRTLAYHEAVPGHHFQRALQVESRDLPAFLRTNPFSAFSAFSEGWALYAERLAAELGWYAGDPVGDLGRLHAELFRARRLVVDTGLHANHWTRQQAIDYGIKEAEVDRYVVLPGQACAYKIGQLRILDLRDRARAAQGPAFDLKQFHNLVLAGGAVPLEILERQVPGAGASTTTRR